jgi:hypothetical protein
VTEQTAANPWTPDQLKFQAWLALPSAVREPKQQKHFASLLEVHETTLCDWKKLPGWHDAVYDLALALVVGELAPVLHAQVKEAKKGSLPHAQWLFEVAGKWTPTSRQQHGNVTGESFSVTVQARDYREGLAPFLPPPDAADG